MRPLFCFAFLAVTSVATAQSSIDFARDIKPILDAQCASCHSTGAHIAFSTRADAINSKVLVPNEPDKSTLYTTVQSGSMPPSGKLPPQQIDLLKRWIASGAVWPEALAMNRAQSPKPESTSAPTGKDTDIAEIRTRILAKQGSAATAGAKYQVTIPNTTISYAMVPVPAGEFSMGSTKQKDESPVHKVKVDAFWMQAHEVTWDEYRLFMFAKQAGEVAHKDEVVDAVSRPTRPYVEMSFGMGINGFPAISMTQHAANKYAEWLSAKTGEFYRLPTEAEWEYACGGGAKTAYPFGDDAGSLGDYAWSAANSGGKYAKVGTKKPNGWGLFDMLGNVMEWTLDGYAPYTGAEVANPYVRPDAPYPIVARGGSWNDPPSALTCSARVQSDPSWKQQDPQLPKSIWYETDAQWLGFRLVRPAKVPTAEEMSKYWNNNVEHDEQ